MSAIKNTFTFFVEIVISKKAVFEEIHLKLSYFQGHRYHVIYTHILKKIFRDSCYLFFCFVEDKLNLLEERDWQHFCKVIFQYIFIEYEKRNFCFHSFGIKNLFSFKFGDKNSLSSKFEKRSFFLLF